MFYRSTPISGGVGAGGPLPLIFVGELEGLEVVGLKLGAKDCEEVGKVGEVVGKLVWFVSVPPANLLLCA